MNKDLNAIIRKALKIDGVEVERTRQGHARFKYHGRVIAIVQHDPRERFIKNLRSDLKRAGIEI